MTVDRRATSHRGSLGFHLRGASDVSVDGITVKSRSLSVAGLFAGIGGIELGMSRAGHRTTILSEIDPAARLVLRHRFPDVRLADDVTKLSELPKETQLLVAGFPCQDLSQAGKTAGLK